MENTLTCSRCKSMSHVKWGEEVFGKGYRGKLYKVCKSCKARFKERKFNKTFFPRTRGMENLKPYWMEYK